VPTRQKDRSEGNRRPDNLAGKGGDDGEPQRIGDRRYEGCKAEPKVACWLGGGGRSWWCLLQFAFAAERAIICLVARSSPAHPIGAAVTTRGKHDQKTLDRASRKLAAHQPGCRQSQV